MNELEVRKVPFMGTELMAARDNDGQIWAGVRWICNGIGMNKTQTNSQVEKIKEDKALMKGYGNFRIPTNGGQQNTLCLKLDYVPLWLAKIAITPRMERETPELAARLEQYQLKAKDVLAAAFLPQSKQQSTTPAPVEQRALTTDDYIIAARLTSDCRNERLPYVLGFLEKGGFEIPKVKELHRDKPSFTLSVERTLINLDDYL